jgi:hypothetical protein
MFGIQERHPTFHWSVLLLASHTAGLFAQSLQLTGATAKPGEWFEVRLSLNSPLESRPSTLQWETTVPYSQLTRLEENTPGTAATAANKTLSCSLKQKSDTTYTSICLLYGGQERIDNGEVSILRLRLAPDAQPGSFRIRIAGAIAVNPAAKPTAIDPAEAVVTITQK